MIDFKWYAFSDLTIEQLYAILSLRSRVFVVEQRCIFLDPDGKDCHAMHLLGQEKNRLVAYMRLFPPTDEQHYLVFGRISTQLSSRKKGYGKKLMEELLHYCDNHFPNIRIQCSAQYYLKKFYETFGFRAISDIYQEDDMPHIAMEKT